MSKDIILKAENISKQYRLGQVGTGTLSHDLNRWWHQVRGKENPYLKIGDTNDRATKGSSDYVWALQDINFEVERGEVLGIIGKNGAGKSTLLKILSKVTAPTTGTIKSRGRIASLLEVGTGFNGEMTGRENIFLNGAILGMTKKEIASKLDEIIDFSGCERYIDTPVKRYSSGMTVRLAFAVAAFLEPEILVIDEVLAVGDAEFQKKAIGKMQDISRGQGRTVLFVSHNMAAVKQLCTKGILLENGRIKFAGNINDTLKVYSDLYHYDYSNLEIGVFDLKQDDQLKNKEFGILRAEMYCNGKLSETVFNGSTFELKIFFNTSRDFYNGEIGIVIKDVENEPIIGVNNHHLGNSLSIRKGAGVGVIKIEDFPIYGEGLLYINLYLGDNNPAEYEFLESIISFNVGIDDINLKGNKLDPNWNRLFHKKISIETI
jgi:lipopolysaccharide transport system ATP-binding protein